MTRPQHTGTHIVEGLSAAMSALAECECGGLYTGIHLLRSWTQRTVVRQIDDQARAKYATERNSLRGDAAQGLMPFEGFDILQDGFDHELIAEF